MPYDKKLYICYMFFSYYVIYVTYLIITKEVFVALVAISLPCVFESGAVEIADSPILCDCVSGPDSEDDWLHGENSLLKGQAYTALSLPFHQSYQLVCHILTMS